MLIVCIIAEVRLGFVLSLFLVFHSVPFGALVQSFIQSSKIVHWIVLDQCRL